MAKKQSRTSVLVGKAAVYSSDAIFGAPKDASRPKPVKIEDEENQNAGGDPWAPWGESNDWPKLLLDKLKKLSVGKRSICLNADAHFGAGIGFFKREVSDDGKFINMPVINEEWEDFEEATNFMLVHSDAIEMLETYYWVPIRCLLSESRRKIVEVEALDPYFCRLGKRNKQGRIDKLYFSYLFPDQPNKEQIVDYPIYDPDKEKGSQNEFIILLRYSTTGKVYYPEPDYYSVFNNGWVDIACSVPEFIKTMYEKSATIKHHIQIPLHFFVNKYKDWQEKEEKEQLKIFEEEQKAMDQFLMGTKNAHKSFVSVFGLDENGNEVPGWKIEPLQDYLKKDAELPNNMAANSEILFAFGVDPSLIGMGIPGGKSLSGSGSDKREGTKVKQAFLFRERLVSMQLVRFIIQFNGIDTQGAKPRYIDVDTSQTLDQNPTGKQTVVNG